MAYVKQTWENLPSINTPITAERLNHMEDGIAEAWEHGGGGGGGETLPIGSRIGFVGLEDDIPAGWQRIDGKVLCGYELYSNNSPTIGNITLNDTIENYEYIEIYMKNIDNNLFSPVQKFCTDNSSTINLQLDLSSNGSDVNLVSALRVGIDGTSLTLGLFHTISLQGNKYPYASSTSNTRYAVYKVIGYK